MGSSTHCSTDPAEGTQSGGKVGMLERHLTVENRRALSLSLMPSLMNDFFQASRLETSSTFDVQHLDIADDAHGVWLPSSSARAPHPNPDSPTTAATEKHDNIILIRDSSQRGQWGRVERWRGWRYVRQSASRPSVDLFSTR